MISMTDSDFQMSQEEFELIRDFIHEKSGIYFAPNKMYLIENRLSKRMEVLEMKSVRDYFYHVKYDSTLTEFSHLMDLITTNETSFFRNEPQLMSFSEEVLPLLIKDKMQGGSKRLKIWSAGCSTGEEPYTLAIMILEHLHSLMGWTIEIIANDISERVLKLARKGEYSGITLRNISPTLLTKYFTQNGDTYLIKPEIKALVKFSHINLNDPRKISFLSGADVVFCRNVMIYFSDDVKRQLVRGFYNSLNPGGYFYVGHSETLHGISKAFKLVYFKNALVYKKEVVTVETGKGRSVADGDNSAVDTLSRSTTTLAASKSAASLGASRAIDLLSQLKTRSAVK